MNFTPCSGSNFRAAVTSPTLPSWIRSERETPRFWYFLATLMTKRRLARTSSLTASSSPARARRPSSTSPAAGEQLVRAHLLQVLVEAGLVLVGRVELGVSAGRRPLPLAWGGAAGLARCRSHVVYRRIRLPRSSLRQSGGRSGRKGVGLQKLCPPVKQNARRCWSGRAGSGWGRHVGRLRLIPAPGCRRHSRERPHRRARSAPGPLPGPAGSAACAR